MSLVADVILDDHGYLTIREQPWINDYGCKRTILRHTKIRLRDTGFTEDQFPIKAAYDTFRHRWVMNVLRFGDTREVPFAHGMVPDSGPDPGIEIVTNVLSDDEVSDSVNGRRQRFISDIVRDRGGKVVEISCIKGVVSKKAVKVFSKWASAVINGFDPESDDLWATLNELDTVVADRLYQSIRNVARWGTTFPSGGSLDLFVMTGPKTNRWEAVVGNVPIINWCEVT